MIARHGKWNITTEAYVDLCSRYYEEIGGLHWIAPLNWPCEPDARSASGLSVDEHQRLTLDSLIEMRQRAPWLPTVPILQGWRRQDYIRHLHMHEAAGIDLSREPLAGLGSVCSRQNTISIYLLVHELARDYGLRLHAFGLSIRALLTLARVLTSSDTHSWSVAARYEPPVPGHTHDRCNSCPEFAASWAAELLSRRITP